MRRKASLYTTIVHMNTTVLIMYNNNAILRGMIQGVSESSQQGLDQQNDNNEVGPQEEKVADTSTASSRRWGLRRGGRPRRRGKTGSTGPEANSGLRSQQRCCPHGRQGERDSLSLSRWAKMYSTSQSLQSSSNLRCVKTSPVDRQCLLTSSALHRPSTQPVLQLFSMD